MKRPAFAVPLPAVTRARHLAPLLWLAIIAGGCGAGGGGSAAPAGPGVSPSCPPASSASGSQCSPWAVRLVERAPTAFVEDGLPVTLEVVVYEPLARRSHPTVVFHHGSTGNGDDPARFRTTWVSEPVARYFVDRGWAVAFPQRRGRGDSGGTYDEGFEPDRSRYACTAALALPGVDRALEDADAALVHVRARAGSDSARLLLAGHSRGGALAIAQAARRPDAVLGAVNFAGGWLGEGCVDAVAVNRAVLSRGASSPHATLWLYGENDPFYSIAHSRAHFNAFRDAGGRGDYLTITRTAGANGHFVIDEPALWSAAVTGFLDRLPAAPAR